MVSQASALSTCSTPPGAVTMCSARFHAGSCMTAVLIGRVSTGMSKPTPLDALLHTGAMTAKVLQAFGDVEP